MTNKWQCVKCKLTFEITVESKILPESLKEVVIKTDIPKVMHCYHFMRNLTNDQYLSEKAVNDSGARDENVYRK